MSTPEWRYQSAFNASLTKTTSTIGIFVADVNGRAQVNVGESVILCRYATKYKPLPGEGVSLVFSGNTVRLTGPTAARSKLGTVTAVAPPYLTITCDGKTYTRMPYLVSYENESNSAGGLGPVVGDTVSINWEGGFVEDAVTVTPDESSIAPKTSTDQHPFTLTFYPTQSGSFKSSTNKWTGTKSDLYCDSSYSAGWFYGNQIHHSVKDDAYISSVEIFLSLRTKSGAEPTIGRHYDKSEQSGGVSLSDGATRGWKGWITLPLDWAQDWRGANGGVAISGGKSVYRGIGTDHQSGKIRIRGRQ